MAWFIPLAISAVGSVAQGKASSDAASANSQMSLIEARSAQEQSLNAEAQQRRGAREFLGRQAAAIAQAGTGPGGSNARIQNESAVNAELDALQTRYKGTLTGWGYTTDAGFQESAGKTAMTSGFLGAGGTLLRGYANYLQHKNPGTG